MGETLYVQIKIYFIKFQYVATLITSVSFQCKSNASNYQLKGYRKEILLLFIRPSDNIRIFGKTFLFLYEIFIYWRFWVLANMFAREQNYWIRQLSGTISQLQKLFFLNWLEFYKEKIVLFKSIRNRKRSNKIPFGLQHKLS